MNISINYLEFQYLDIEKTKNFYSSLFNWDFTDYWDSYTAFKNSGIEGGFFLSNEPMKNGVLVVLYSKQLENIQQKIVEFGGQITKKIFSFPGGRRFHFKDVNGNELAIWSE